MLSIIVRIPILNSQCIYFVHSKMIRNAHRLLNSMAVHPGPLPQGEGERGCGAGKFTSTVATAGALRFTPNCARAPVALASREGGGWFTLSFGSPLPSDGSTCLAWRPRCSAGFQTCCIAGFQPANAFAASKASGLATVLPIGNRRYSRFGNLRYAQKALNRYRRVQRHPGRVWSQLRFRV